MDSNRHAHVKDLFLRALGLREPDRNSMLSEACAADRSLRDEVELLLACATEIEASNSNAGPDSSDDVTDVSGGAPESQAPVGPRKCPKCRMSFPTDVYFCHNDGEALVANPEFLVGTLFDEIYEIETLLGEGGMGTVYRARHRLLRDIVTRAR